MVVDQVGAAVAVDAIRQDRAAVAELARAERTGRGGSAVRVLLAQLDDLGLGGSLDESRRWLDRAEVLADEVRRARADAEREQGALVHRLAAGEVSVAEVVAAGPLYRSVMPDGPGSSVVAGSVVDCRRRAETAARAGAGAVWKSLVKEAERVVAESVKLAKGLPVGVDSEADAWRAGGAVVEVWSRLGLLVDRFVAVHEAVESVQGVTRTQVMTLDADSTLEPPSQGWMRYRAPWKLPADYMGRAPQLRLSVAAAAGAGPGLYAAEDAVARYVAHARGGMRSRLSRAMGVS